MVKYFVEVPAHARGGDYAVAHFKSRAMTEAGILRAAIAALRRNGYATFIIPSTRDVAAVVNGRLVYVDAYQRMGLFR